MGLFNVTDVENAVEDPFSLKPGRQVIVITKSEEDSVTINKDKPEEQDVDVWNVTVANEKDDTEQRITFWLEGTEEQQARTNSNIKKMLIALEIPTSEWESVSNHPEKLVGHKCTVNAVAGKGKNEGKVYVNWVGVPVPEAAPSSEGTAEFAGATTSNPPKGFGFNG